ALFSRPHMPLIITAAIALDDFSEVNGATHLIPGSQLWPADRMPEQAEVIRAEMTAGSMLVWDGAIYHGGGANQTPDQTRRTLTFNYTRGWLRTQFNQYLSVPRERVLNMPAELQADLGYHRSALGLGGCDMQDPLAYLQQLMEAGGDGFQRLLGRENS
ncbi:MAG: phytanoyl-CoA dioxygenase family protein, partial [Proteobacteria bacterium]|nr:phytanoyl-CoA dioxygenase family protein [Pseudomonadota bacterium]